MPNKPMAAAKTITVVPTFTIPAPAAAGAAVVAAGGGSVIPGADDDVVFVVCRVELVC